MNKGPAPPLKEVNLFTNIRARNNAIGCGSCLEILLYMKFSGTSTNPTKKITRLQEYIYLLLTGTKLSKLDFSRAFLGYSF